MGLRRQTITTGSSGSARPQSVLGAGVGRLFGCVLNPASIDQLPQIVTTGRRRNCQFPAKRTGRERSLLGNQLLTVHECYSWSKLRGCSLPRPAAGIVRAGPLDDETVDGSISFNSLPSVRTSLHLFRHSLEHARMSVSEQCNKDATDRIQISIAVTVIAVKHLRIRLGFQKLIPELLPRRSLIVQRRLRHDIFTAFHVHS